MSKNQSCRLYLYALGLEPRCHLNSLDWEVIEGNPEGSLSKQVDINQFQFHFHIEF